MQCRHSVRITLRIRNRSKGSNENSMAHGLAGVQTGRADDCSMMNLYKRQRNPCLCDQQRGSRALVVSRKYERVILRHLADELLMMLL
jgi:hypothetical protein